MKAAAKRRTGLPVEFAQAPMRTVRTADAATVYAHPGTQMVRLERLGLLHNVVPRALGIAIVAVAGDRRDIVLRDRDGLVHFVQRETDVLDAELMTTDLGQCLVTTAEQTVLDLAHRPNLGHVAEEARAAIVALLPRCNEETLERLAGQQRLRAALTRVRRAAR